MYVALNTTGGGGIGRSCSNEDVEFRECRFPQFILTGVYVGAEQHRHLAGTCDLYAMSDAIGWMLDLKSSISACHG